jgi:hypothetical protein
VTDSFRCASEAATRGDPLAGTASTVRAFLLVEHPGPWGVDALQDARLPAGLGEHLAAAGRRSGVRVLLVRRPGRTRRDGVRVLAAHTGGPVADDAWLEVTEVDDLAACSELDLAAVGAGRPPGWTRVQRPLLAVCTHGRHDACCAERGRPVAAALAESHPDQTWEVSHVGGDRFAANLLVLPHGLYYGRVDGESARLVADAAAEGRVVPDLLRGRSSLPMPVQAAEVALRRELGEDRLAAVVWRGRRREGDTVTVRFDVAGTTYAVVVDVGRAEPAPLTCRAAGPSAPWLFTVRGIHPEPL